MSSTPGRSEESCAHPETLTAQKSCVLVRGACSGPTRAGGRRLPLSACGRPGKWWLCGVPGPSESPRGRAPDAGMRAARDPRAGLARRQRRRRRRRSPRGAAVRGRGRGAPRPASPRSRACRRPRPHGSLCCRRTRLGLADEDEAVLGSACWTCGSRSHLAGQRPPGRLPRQRPGGAGRQAQGGRRRAPSLPGIQETAREGSGSESVAINSPCTQRHGQHRCGLSEFISVDLSLKPSKIVAPLPSLGLECPRSSPPR